MKKLNGTMHFARGFRSVRDSDFVALAAQGNAFSDGR